MGERLPIVGLKKTVPSKPWLGRVPALPQDGTARGGYQSAHPHSVCGCCEGQKAQTLSKNAHKCEVLVPGSRVRPQGCRSSGPKKEAEFESTGGVSWGKASKEET